MCDSADFLMMSLLRELLSYLLLVLLVACWLRGCQLIMSALSARAAKSSDHRLRYTVLLGVIVMIYSSYVCSDYVDQMGLTCALCDLLGLRTCAVWGVRSVFV